MKFMALYCILVSFMAQKYVLLFRSYSTFLLNVPKQKIIEIDDHNYKTKCPLLIITYCYQDNIRELRGLFYLCISIVD